MSFSIRKAAIQSVTAITGPTHLIVQTTADLIAHSEGYIVSKINPEITKAQALNFRRKQTKVVQQDYNVARKDIAKALKGSFKVPTVMGSSK
jgi:hypothetical protein